MLNFKYQKIQVLLFSKVTIYLKQTFYVLLSSQKQHFQRLTLFNNIEVCTLNFFKGIYHYHISPHKITQLLLEFTKDLTYLSIHIKIMSYKNAGWLVGDPSCDCGSQMTMNGLHVLKPLRTTSLMIQGSRWWGDQV